MTAAATSRSAPSPEEALIGGLLAAGDPALVREALAIARPGDFADPLLARIAQALLDLADRGDPIDATTVHVALSRESSVDGRRAAVRIAELMDIEATGAHAPYYARAVHRAALERREREAAARLAAETDGELRASARRSLMRIATEIETERASASPSLVTVMLARVRGEHVTWLWPGRIPLGKLSILDGDPGLGKSLLTLDLAARVSTGARMPDGAPSIDGGAGVVLLSAEDGLGDTIRPRLEAAGADLERVVAVTAMPTDDGPRMPELPEDVLAIEQVVRDTGARLVVVDPLMAYLAAAVNANRDHDVRRALAPLAAMAERTGAAVLVVRHLNKGGSAGANPLYRGGGSIGIIGAARSGLLAARDPDDPDRRVLAITKNNLAAPVPALRWRIVTGGDAPVVEWLGATNHTAASLMAEPEGEERTARDEAAEWLRDALRDGPQPAAELLRRARADGYHERTLRRARERIGARALKAGMSGGWVWSL